MYFDFLFVIGLSLFFIGSSLKCTSRIYRRGIIKLSISPPPSYNKRDQRYEKLLQTVDYKRTSTSNSIEIAKDPIIPQVQTAILAADLRKATSISALRISHLTEITTFMVIIEGNSRPQNQAIASSVEDDLKTNFNLDPSKQGSAVSGWIVLDYGYLIVHVMTPQLRNFYKLEKRWKDADIYDVECFLASADRRKEQEGGENDDGGDGREESGDKFYSDNDDVETDRPEEDSDPFWK